MVARDLWPVWIMMGRSGTPAAAAVAKPALNECPAKSPSIPFPPVNLFTTSATPLEESLFSKVFPYRSITRNTGPLSVFSSSSQSFIARTGQVAGVDPDGIPKSLPFPV
jgi:hypothetical protein